MSVKKKTNEDTQFITMDTSAIIPFKDKSSMTIDCVRSLKKFGPELKEIILVSNNSSEQELTKIKQEFSNDSKVKVLTYNHPYNYHKINNWAVGKCSGKFILFMNNDTELVPQSKGLIEDILHYAAQEDIGVVGCLLLYEDGQHIQHAGVYLVSGDMAEHIHKGKRLPKTSKQLMPKLKNRKVTAVTAAVCAVERSKFEEVNGFNEEFVIGGGDVDLCIRLSLKGYETWLVTGTRRYKYILHKEKMSRAEIAVPYDDYVSSYNSYIKAYDLKTGDRHTKV